MQDGGPVVVVVRVGREGEDEAIDVRGGDADGEAGWGVAEAREAGGGGSV